VDAPRACGCATSKRHFSLDAGRDGRAPRVVAQDA
jgi:hypothetical protein